MKGIKYICPQGSSGYAEAAKDYIIALHKLGIPITVEFLKFDNSNYQKGHRNNIVNSLVNRKIDYNKLIIHCTPEHWNKIIEKHKNIPGLEIIGYTVWETNKLDPRWVTWINNADKVFVPCNWNVEVFNKSGVNKPIYVIPHIFQHTPYKGKILGLKNEFVFYTIGQWTERKGIRESLIAYLNAFTNRDNVCFIIKTFKDDYSKEQQQIIKSWVNEIMSKYPNPAKVILLLDELTDSQISVLHSVGHCCLSLCKAEGWGLGAFEAVGVGNLIVMTGYGGQTDFFKNFKVSYDLIPVQGMSWIPWYNETQYWAQPNIEEATSILKHIYKNYSSLDKIRIEQKEYVLNNFNYDKIGKKIIEILQ